MITIRPRTAVLALVAAAIVAASGLSAHGGQARAHDSEWVAPESAAARTNPLADKPAAEAGGRKLFEQKCASCHGDDGRGTDKAPDLTQPDVQSQTDGALFWKISSGNTRRGMPSFSFLPEVQRWQLVLRVRTLR